jgi:hypothetical protein
VLRACFLLIGVGAAALGGCAAYSVDYAAELNRRLAYLPWADPSDFSQHQPFRVLPGMRLVFAVMPLLPHDAGSPPRSANGNTQPVPPTITRWIVPTGDIPTTEDIFVYAWLLDIAVPQGVKPDAPDTDAFQYLRDQSVRERAKPKPDRSQPPDFAQNFYNVIRSSLKITFAHARNPTASPWSAKQIKYWMCSGSVSDIGDKAKNVSAQTLQFDIRNKDGGLQVFETFGWSPWFIDSNSDAPASDYQNVFYTSPSVGGPPDVKGRGNLGVEIPVRLSNETQSRYVSACATVQDYEKATGVIVTGLRRSITFMPDFHDQFGNLYGNVSDTSLVSAGDQYFTVNFENYNPILGAKFATPLIAGGTLNKNEILLAPGDVLVGFRDPSRATDISPATNIQ